MPTLRSMRQRSIWRALGHMDPLLIDGIIALAVFALMAQQLITRHLLPGQRPTTVLTWLLAVLIVAPILTHRRFPRASVTVCLGAVAIYAAGDYVAYPGFAIFVLTFDIALHSEERISVPTLFGAEETEDVKVLILTTFDLDEYVYAALRAGASGFLLKDTPPNDLLAGIRVVAAGDALLAPSVTRQLISEFVRRPDSDRPPPVTLDVLTSREREVLTLVARGWSNAEIAERLYLSPATSKTHVGRLLTKLQARDRTQLVVIAYETGLVTPSGPLHGA